MQKTLKYSHIFKIRPQALFVVMLITLSTFSLTGLFILSALENDKEVKIIKYAPISEVKVLASKQGKKYYYPWCGGVSKIKDKNLVSFKTYKEAEGSGLTLARNCNPPL